MDVRLLLCCCSYQSLALLLLQREPSRVGTGPGRCSGEDAGTFLPCAHVGRGPGSMEGARVVTCQQACSFRPARGRVGGGHGARADEQLFLVIAFSFPSL